MCPDKEFSGKFQFLISSAQLNTKSIPLNLLMRLRKLSL